MHGGHRRKQRQLLESRVAQRGKRLKPQHHTANGHRGHGQGSTVRDCSSRGEAARAELIHTRKDAPSPEAGERWHLARSI